MHCLNDCENAVLDFFFGMADRSTTLYQCAEKLYAEFDNVAVIAACGILADLGLLKSCGDSTNYFALSPAAMGDVGNGYFRGAGNVSEHMLKLEKQLLELQVAQDRVQAESAAAAAARPAVPHGVQTQKKK